MFSSCSPHKACKKLFALRTPPIKRPEVAECGEEATFAGLGTALAVQLVAVIALLAKAFRARREERKLRGLVGEFSKLSQASIDLVRRSGGGSRGGSGHHPPLMIEELMENSLSRLSPAAKAFLDRYPVGGEETMVKERFGQEEEYKESAGP